MRSVSLLVKDNWKSPLLALLQPRVSLRTEGGSSVQGRGQTSGEGVACDTSQEDGRLLWTSSSRSRSSRLQCAVCHEPILSPGESSIQAEQAMYKCQGVDCKTKDPARRYVDLMPVVFRAEDDFCWNEHSGGDRNEA